MLGKCALSKGRRQSGLSGELSASANTRSRFIWLTSIIVAILLTEIAPRFTPEGLEHWQYALHRLYYLPIISAGLTFGWGGDLAAAMLLGLSYLSHSRESDSPDARNLLDRYLETLVFCLVGALAGVLASRERKQRTLAEQRAL